jgi:hypothetical protein
MVLEPRGSAVLHWMWLVLMTNLEHSRQQWVTGTWKVWEGKVWVRNLLTISCCIYSLDKNG